MNALKRTFKDISQYPSAIAGVVIILALVALAVYTVFAIPYGEAIRLWRGGEEIWGDYPRLAPPAWTNILTKEKQPSTIVRNSVDEDPMITKEVKPIDETMTDVIFTYSFDYDADVFPQEMIVFMTATFKEKGPFVSMFWITPDGREIRLGEVTASASETYRFNQDDRLLRRLKGVAPEVALFADPEKEAPTVLKGTYQLRIDAITFEEGSDLEAKFVSYGTVHGLAGTDHRRRDLSIALLWGTPIALAFGLVAALVTTVTTMVIAAIGVWFGGVVDDLIQRITEINMLLPFLPILIMVGTFQSRSIWVLLLWVILLSIFGASIKGYRATFLQIKEAPYIEAARSYGASNWRIIVSYLIPRIIPVLIPGLVSGVPAYVFLEASLAVLGLGDPVLPTWGKLINDAYGNGALYNGQYYWILEPALLLMIAGLAFAMVGFALDRIFNPRLREV
ncbi:MAG: ABC transporter permease, partial [Anaerolineae bacterium]|nr:ABC transporter permease [Anaerolineae bacterium]